MNFFNQRSRFFSILKKGKILSMIILALFYLVRTRGASPNSILVRPRRRSTTTFVVVKSILDPDQEMIIRDAILISFIMPSKLTGNILRRHWFQVTAISEGNIFRFISLQKQTGWIASVMILSNCLLKGSFQLSLFLNGQQVSSSISVQYNCHSCKVNLLTFPLHQTEI